MTRNSYSIGIVLIAIAVLLLLGKLGVFSFLGALLWPLLLLGAGLALNALYFSRMLPSGVLIPAGILVTYSVLFLLCNIFGWGAMRYLWPGFIFGVAVGFYEVHLFDRQAPRSALVAAIALAVLSGLLFLMTFVFTFGLYLIAFILIVAGIYLILRRSRFR